MSQSTATPNKSSKGDTDASSAAQGRFTVAIPAEAGAMLDEIGKVLSEAVRHATGVSVELSRAQVVTSLIKTAAASHANGAASVTD